jgi:UDP-N-acetylglucosamine acyltransferase
MTGRLGWSEEVLPSKKTDRGELWRGGRLPEGRAEGTSMPVAASAQIHATAIVSAESIIADGVRIGPYTVIEGPVTVGPDCVVGPHVHLVGPLTLGRNNFLGTGTVIGTDPQHLAYEGQPTRTEIGDANVFREHVTIHRGSHVTGVTRVGNKNYFMSHSHVAHDCRVADECVLANAVLLAGHCELQDRVFMGGSSAIHQFVRMGRLSLLTGLVGVTKDVIPFLTVKDRFTILGVNAIGMKRAGTAAADIMEVRRAFHILYRSGLILKAAVDHLSETCGSHPLVAEMLQFIRESKRGVMRPTGQRGGSDE